jgi:mono/diheme cytochrome c family protein
LAVGDKAGDFVILDRTNGKLVSRLAVSNQQGIFTTAPSLEGTFACPNHGGGIEWNGGSYDDAVNLFFIPSTQECAIWKIVYPATVPYVAGQPFTAGPLPKRRTATGVLTAVDVGTGKPAWIKPLPYSAQGGVLVTRNGLIFTSDASGRVYAFEPKTGRELWHDDAGASIVAPISAYQGSDGHEYIVVEAGEAGNQQTPNLPIAKSARVVAYSVSASPTVMNDATGQPAAAVAGAANSESGSAGAAAATVSAPYTVAQASAGSKVYVKQCLSCHGAHLQGVSGPALTGPGFAHSSLNIAQLYGIVSQQMPLTSPGSLSKTDDAAVTAYILSYDCVKPTGTAPLSISVAAALSTVKPGAASCPPK